MWCSVLLLSSACVADAADEWIPTEVDQDALMDKVSDKTVKLVCSRFESSVHRLYRTPLLVKAACTAHALQSSRDVEECATLTDQCMNTLPAVVDEQLNYMLEQAGCGDIQPDHKGCRSTVSELIACLGDLGDEVSQIKLEATCAAFGSRIPEDWWKVSPPVSCVDVFTRCRG
ncbi:MAG: hypothetical protein SFX73_36300 [Kofleriaceae bacterium]|nr:hypothetical protein [Kofleriaceae bacterium]